MNLETLLEKGYLLKELPPCFVSDSFSKKIHLLDKEWTKLYSSLSRKEKEKYNTSECLKFSYPKDRLTRRILKIQNPLHFYKLGKIIVENWKVITEKLEKSNNSQSRPIIDGEKRAVKPICKNVSSFKEKKIEISFDKLYELRIDISKFYDSVYTHTISWAIHGKKEAKGKMNDANLLGNKIDKNLRYSQERQSLGIPTGPDTSYIIGELILCKLDQEIKNKNITFCRFADDIFIYDNKENNLLKNLRNITKIFNEYSLDLNENKTKIRKFPFEIEKEWVKVIREFSFENLKEKEQRQRIWDFFNYIFLEIEKSQQNSILIYSKYKLMEIDVDEKNWDIFENLFYKSILICPGIIDVAIKILKKYEKRINKSKLRKLIIQIIDINIDYNNDFEVTWDLWLAKVFEIKINERQIIQIIKDLSPICCLLALDLYKNDLVNIKKDDVIYETLKNRLENKNFFSDDWILIYELNFRKWISNNLEGYSDDLFETDKFSNLLLEKEIYFYDDNLEVIEEKKEFPFKKSLGKAKKRIEKEYKNDFYTMELS